MIDDAQVAFYHEHGYVVVPGVLSKDEFDELRAVTDRFVEGARKVDAHDDVYDLEDSHSSDDPRVRRIKTPHLQHEAYAKLVRHAGMVSVMQRLIGEAIRFDTSKLNMKAAGFGAPVEWHQDWAFYPHTNDDLLATGILLDDCDLENGPLLVLPGSHRGPILDHHAEGVFCGAILPEALRGYDLGAAVPLTGPAGSVTFHHARILHASAPNRSGRPRRMIFHQYRAADAWPLLGFAAGLEAYDALMVAGEPSITPRLADVPVRLPLPPAAYQGSIYENQRGLGKSFFADAAAG